MGGHYCPPILKGENMGNLDNFALEYRRGVDDTIKEILTIVKNSEYPEDLEMNICEWLEDKGVQDVY